MTPYEMMLDTNIISHLMRFPYGPVRERLLATPSAACVSVVVVCELRFGARRVNSRRLDAQITDILSVIDTVSIGPEIVPHYAGTRASLERQGTPIGSTDLLIAAHALALDVTLVTANIREFSRVPNLRVENWLD
jgi:tRNA(fMet)-specific endonuclease VapC